MRQFTAKEIQDQFEKLPVMVQNAITSEDVNGKIKAISNKNGLNVDQLGELVDEIGLVMLGLKKSSSFIPNVSARLSIPTDKASQIAKDVETDVFSSIKLHLRQNEEIASVERAGQFAIDKLVDEPIGSPLESKSRLIDGIENPAKPIISTRSMETSHTDAIVDRLLGSPSVTTEVKTGDQTTPPPNLPTQSAPIPEKAGPDPYREPIN